MPRLINLDSGEAKCSIYISSCVLVTSLRSQSSNYQKQLPHNILSHSPQT